jgi:hypothetical protein
MNFFSKIRRNIVTEGGVYKVSNLFGTLVKENETPEIDNPEFYDITTKTLKLGNLCVDELNKEVTPSIEIDGTTYTTYCALLQLSHNLPKNIVNQYHKDLDTIYNFLRRDLSLDNRRKFHSLIKTLLNYENPANSIRLITQYIEKTEDNDEIGRALDKFRVSNVNESDIEEFLKQIKYMGYTEYENSFLGDHFSKNRTRLILKYKSNEENRGIYRIVKDVMGGVLNISEAVSILHNGILENYTPKEMVKGDLICNTDIYDEDGNVVIGSGDIVEVKKLDYHGDSYLSEFFAIYKYSKLSKDVSHPNFIKTYNKLIDGLFTVLSSSSSNVLDDIKKNFAGIIYDDKTFVSSDDIELYWSNKGRSSCSKDHRLSIRYRINKPSIFGYVYTGSDFVTKKPLKISLDKEKIFCPIIKEKKIEESFSINQISNLLLEGRKEDAKEKYPMVDDIVFNYYVDQDPSGNQKYLDWMLGTTLVDYKQYRDNDLLRPGKRLMTYHIIMVDTIQLFHKHQQMVEGSLRDINQYKDLYQLKRVVDEIKKKLLKKKEQKEAKKEKDVIYQDDRWLVISPRSWKASCYYGSGTRWCITSKESSTHWDKYSRRASFFFVIDKTKKQNDPLYKVAYRVIGGKGKYELWNAEDSEISKSQTGEEWFESLPKEIKEKSRSYHKQKFPKVEKPEWVDGDPRAQVLGNHLDPDEIILVGDEWYGIPIYEVDGESWVVGNSTEMDEASYYYYNDFDDDDLIDYNQEGDYLTMIDEDNFIDNEVDYELELLTDREFLEYGGYEDTWDLIENEIRDLRIEMGDLDSEEDINEIEGNIAALINEQQELVEDTRERYADNIRSEWYKCLSDGPVQCLIYDKGWYRNTYDLYRSGIVELDREGLIRMIIDYDDYNSIAGTYGYDVVSDEEGYDWFVFQVDY